MCACVCVSVRLDCTVDLRVREREEAEEGGVKERGEFVSALIFCVWGSLRFFRLWRSIAPRSIAPWCRYALQNPIQYDAVLLSSLLLRLVAVTTTVRGRVVLFLLVRSFLLHCCLCTYMCAPFFNRRAAVGLGDTLTRPRPLFLRDTLTLTRPLFLRLSFRASLLN